MSRICHRYLEPRVNVQSGSQGNLGSGEPSLSADGTAVAFHSLATNLDGLDSDTTFDIYVKNLVTGDLTLASVAAGVKGNGRSQRQHLSGDGTLVVFESFSTNLDSRDTDTFRDVYIKDIVGGDLTLLSTNELDEKGNNTSQSQPSLADGRTCVPVSCDEPPQR